MQLGTNNTFEEYADEQERAQLARLADTWSGRALLQELGFDEPKINSLHEDIPLDTRQRFAAKPLPRNMDSEHNTERRLARGVIVFSAKFIKKSR
ncbi:hypothetical protein HPB49_016291 [Dermacentor silvarum]|uniref:Uncharacterized protein n=1 Tax=Dermacentor silvarum TaxID=543639 RepID=A0ACB8CS14_DERSI|nr:hypothetical protein HPB49_016291 [Dermacentor silvarum]